MVKIITKKNYRGEVRQGVQRNIVPLASLIENSPQNGYSPICPNEPTGKWVLGLSSLSEQCLDLSEAKPAPANDPLVDRFLLRHGDFLISRSNTIDKVGRVGVFRGGLDNCSYPDLMMRFRPDTSKIYPDYLEVYLRSEATVKYIQSHATGTSGSMKKINQSIVESIPILLPPPDDQKKIAAIHTAWDTAIEKTEKLIEAKKKQFKWLLKMFLGRTSETAKWRRVKLGEVAEIAVKEKLQTVYDETLLTVKLHCKGIEKNSRMSPRLTERGRPYYKRHAGEFLIGRQNFHNGGFGIVPDEFDGFIASNAITSLKINKDKLSSTFLFYFFSRETYYKRIGHIMDGTGQKELSDKQILNLQLRIPSVQHQKQIASTLNTARHEIDLLKKQAEAYRKQKRGLMQKLLTGQWRVKTK